MRGAGSGCQAGAGPKVWRGLHALPDPLLPGAHAVLPVLGLSRRPVTCCAHTRPQLQKAAVGLSCYRMPAERLNRLVDMQYCCLTAIGRLAWQCLPSSNPSAMLLTSSPSAAAGEVRQPGRVRDILWPLPDAHPHLCSAAPPGHHSLPARGLLVCPAAHPKARAKVHCLRSPSLSTFCWS